MNNLPIILRFTLLVASVFLSACSPEPTDSVSTEPVSTNSLATGTSNEVSSRPNILLIIGDDMGNESLSCFDIGRNPAKTPALDTLCADGVRFNNFWSQPVCSPTRATLLTGRYGFRTGIGDPTGADETMGPFPKNPEKPASAPYEPPRGSADIPAARPINWGLPTSEYTLPMAFHDDPLAAYSVAAIGKWHLADNKNGWLDHPNLVGFDHYAGLIRGFPDSFFAWNKVVNGEITGVTGYTPDDKVEDALNWIDEQGERPWFLWFAFNLVHDPLHLPPEPLWRSDHSDIDPMADPLKGDKSSYFKAMLEALDSEVEKLLAGLEPEVRENTYVIFIGDNGTESDWIARPFRSGKAKGTVYQGGINVPLMVTGPNVQGGTLSEALVNSTDLFSTILEMAGIDVQQVVPSDAPIDSVSIMPYLNDPGRDSIRKWVYADTFELNFEGIEEGDYAIRDNEYKLMRHRGEIQFYNLVKDPYEYFNLFEREMNDVDQKRYEALLNEVTTLRQTRFD